MNEESGQMSKKYPEKICRCVPSDMPMFDFWFSREVIGPNDNYYHIDRCLLEFGEYLLSIVQTSSMGPNIFEVAVMNNDEDQEFCKFHEITGDLDVKQIRYYDLDFMLLHMMKLTKTSSAKIRHKDINDLLWLQPYYEYHRKDISRDDRREHQNAIKTTL